MKKEWFKTFFREDYWRAYTSFLKDVQTKKEVNFIVDVLGLSKDMSILDLCNKAKV